MILLIQKMFDILIPYITPRTLWIMHTGEIMPQKFMKLLVREIEQAISSFHTCATMKFIILYIVQTVLLERKIVLPASDFATSNTASSTANIPKNSMKNSFQRS